MKDEIDLIYDVIEEPIVLNKSTLDLLLKQKNPVDLIALYSFYYYTAKWQGSNKVKATVGYAAEGLKIARPRIRKAKKILINLELISESQNKKEDGSFSDWYIKVHFIQGARTALHDSQRAVKPEANALRANRNRLKNKRKNIKKENKKISNLKLYAKKFLISQKEIWPNLIREIDNYKIEECAITLDKLIRLDGHDFETDIKPALDWAINDEFWNPQILSLRSLRKKSKSNGNTKFVNILLAYLKIKKRSTRTRRTRNTKYDNLPEVNV